MCSVMIVVGLTMGRSVRLIYFKGLFAYGRIGIGFVHDCVALIECSWILWLLFEVGSHYPDQFFGCLRLRRVLSVSGGQDVKANMTFHHFRHQAVRSEEHTSELQ